jgi:predicted amidohydrolase YtcJ
MARRNDWDLLAMDGRIHSLEREGEIFAAMSVKDGRIARLFAQPPSKEEWQQARAVLDLQGRSVLPGLIDGHMHFLAAAVVRAAACIIADMHPDGLGPQTMDDVRRKMCAWAARLPAHKLVFCFSYIIDLVAEKRLPRNDELDSWLPGREVIVFSMDGHSSSLSTPALRRLGLTEKAVGGVLRGSEHEMSMGVMNGRVAANVSMSMLVQGIQTVVNEALSQGLVCLHCMEGYEDQASDPSLWFLARCGGTLPVDLRLFTQYRDPARLAPYRRFLRSPRIGGCYGWAMDGSISSATAALDEPYI